VRYIHSRSFGVRGPDGQVLRVAGMAEDVTERRQADELKDTLLASVSHAIQSPLTAILANLEALQAAHQLDAGGTNALRVVTSEAFRLSRTMRNLLDYLRIQTGVWKARREWCVVEELIGATLADLPGGQAQRLETRLPEPITLAWVDPVQLVLILTNLVENALKYSPEGSRVLLTAEKHGDDLHVVVSDRGCGIGPEALPHIFSPFSRASEAEETGVPGSGLGLAICHSLVRLHAGELAVASVPGSGSAFRISLPAAARGRGNLQAMPSAACLTASPRVRRAGGSR
jgi:two-component system, OmpR family, sensor histidine kinase KdpD